MTAKLTEIRTPLRATAPPRSVRPALPPRAYTPPARHSAQAASRYVPAKAVGAFVPTLTKKAFEKFGFAAATLITDWVAIAGSTLASYTAPERLKWPRAPEMGESAEGRPGATLVLRVDPARALDVEYNARQIIERINAYFGYRAVAQLRLVQAPVTGPKTPATRASRDAKSAGTSATKPEEDALAAALARLEAGVMKRR